MIAILLVSCAATIREYYPGPRDATWWAGVCGDDEPPLDVVLEVDRRCVRR